jgi:hypothetical protein
MKRLSSLPSGALLGTVLSTGLIWGPDMPRSAASTMAPAGVATDPGPAHTGGSSGFAHGPCRLAEAKILIFDNH